MTNSTNPYEAPSYELMRQEARLSISKPAIEGLLGTVGIQRMFAAPFDFVAALFVSSLVIGPLSGDGPIPLWVTFAAAFAVLCYYFLSEWLVGATLGKLVLGLRVRQISGRRCTARQAATRTLWRIIEVNPLLFGGLPAFVSMLLTQRRQRIGDWIAGTVVVQVPHLRAFLARKAATQPDQDPTVQGLVDAGALASFSEDSDR